MTDIAGCAAFVTGGGSGIGRALALGLGAQGCPVAVADITASRAEEVAVDIRAAGGHAVGIACDVSDRASVAGARDEARSAVGAPTLLFANAGVTSLEPFIEMPAAELDWVLEVNLFGVLHCLEAFLPDMIAAGGGHVVATSSLAGLLPGWIPDHVPYVASKAGVVATMLNLRSTLARSNIGCMVLCPGGVATNIMQAPSDRPARFGLAKPAPIVPSGDLASTMVFRPPEEVARMVFRAMAADEPVLITDAAQRDLFVSGYVDPIMAAFERAGAYETESG